MKLKALIAAIAVAALPLAASAATFVVPAAGSGAGNAGSQWQSELTLHSAAPRIVTVDVTFHQGKTVLGPETFTLQPRETRTIEDIVKSEFGVESGTGALVVSTSDRDARGLAITSRTLNVSPAGEFGQDIPSVSIANATIAGDIATLTGPSDATTNRFNFGIYAVDATTVLWQLVRANGTIDASVEVAYAAGEHAQYGSGIRSLLGKEPAGNDTVYARIVSGRAIAYGSIINVTGDPSFVPAVRTRDDIMINFAGVDLDENGTIDIADANNDGVLDAPIQMMTSMWGSYFRVVARGEFDENVTFEIVSSPAAAVFLDASGTMRVSPFGDVKGTTGEIIVKVKSGTSESLITIPVVFK